MRIFIESVELIRLNSDHPMVSVRGRDASLNDGIDIIMPLTEEQEMFLWEHRGQLVNVEITFSEIV